jgi:hypothetical protein
VSVYDDSGHLVGQYLRGVSFPASKQDLLRFARTTNAGPAVVHSIEGLADRTYANANDVPIAINTETRHAPAIRQENDARSPR